MKHLSLISILLFFGMNTQAYTVSIYGGIHNSSAKQDLDPAINGQSSIDTSGALGGQLGGRFEAAIRGSQLFLGGGIEAAYKSFQSLSVLNYHVASIDVPVFLKYRFTDTFALYSGLKLSFNIDARCDGQPGCDVPSEDIEPLSFPIFVGGSFAFNEHWAIDIFYEHALTPMLKSEIFSPGNTSLYEAYASTYGANLVYTF